jgi:alkylation response protein AidB-like acyl-CoA dehydrogenase
VELDETGIDCELRAALRHQLGTRGQYGPAAEDATHRCLVELDLFGLEVASSDGGLDLGLSPSVVVCEELGRRGIRNEYRATALLADVLLHGTEGAGSDHRRRIARGELLGAAITEPNVVTMERASERVVLRGHPLLVDPIERASALVVRAREDSRDVFVVLPLPLTGVKVEGPVDQNPGKLAFESTSVEPIALVPWPETGRPASATMVTKAQVRQAAHLLGLASYAHELAVARSLTRQQFGHPLVQFQGVAFPLAAEAARHQAVRLLIQRAAWLIDEHQMEGAWAGIEALASASELALEICRRSVQIHGAIGMTTAAEVSRLYIEVGVEIARWGAPSLLWREAGRLRAGAES